MDDPVQALDGARDLEVALDRHAESRVHVAHLERGRQAVAGSVGDRDPEDPVGDRDEVEVVAAHELRRRRESGDLDVPAPQGALREDRHLDAARFLERRHVPALPELLVHRVAQDPERGEEVLFRRGRLDGEGDDVLVVADGDRGEALGAEAPLELRVHPRRRRVHDDDTLVDDPLDRAVVVRNEEAGRDRPARRRRSARARSRRRGARRAGRPGRRARPRTARGRRTRSA